MFAVSALASSPALANAKYAGIVVDAKTGKVLYSDDADALRYPASLTKMMTLYLTFEALESGRISLDSPVPVSAHAAAEPPTKLGVRAGGAVTVEQAIKALITRSANDMATALGEMIGGSEARFAQLMTTKARALGMTKTTYRNAHGLPNTAQMTTARDQARLGIALRQHFPQYYPLFSIRSFKFGKQTIGNHNRLLGSVRGVDGIKTGYTRASGFNLVSSVQADGRSVVAVVMGGTSGGARDAQMRKLIAAYFPQASTGRGNNLIAEVRTPSLPKTDVPVPVQPQPSIAVTAASQQVAALDLPSSVPVPAGRYAEKLAGASAYASEPTSNTAVAAVTAAMGGTASVGVPSPAPAYMPPATVASAEQERAATDKVTTGSTRRSDAPSGWVIQIGVSADQSSAMTLLQSAQDKGGKVLRTAKPFTVAVNSGGSQLYRARFGGFDDQKGAVDACNVLKRKGVACWASQQ
ncbi:D-alanyl-D-alanine carboxypeptidase [Rhizobium sp. SSA_523]|uniref:D-alanyl-D-alanine carboxypeptidase n=1 Tax=Rhizobium sp. SSA_523 TaxID=2952477 RepID=UPI002091A9BE|nr:D-alanyl-D-alanine carboxypeptidase [Rhizobium sp. SSA_523]MCO5733839.1 D-alanyl-D-alanine carboxypeptidase [Rhizobium sp. SSA_523]WKC25897.1 D-alanyl-D-alanine carboxypeptidase [Rhizobium sp. SSA_523]